MPSCPERVNAGRRAFLGLCFAAGGAAVLSRLPQPEPGSDPAELGNNAAPAVVPPGAQGVERFLDQCTACGLCIANCPTQVLRPAALSLGVRGFMKPVLDFSRAACDPSCTTCSQLCPAGALLPLSLAEKQRTQIGLVQYEQQFCRAWSEGVECALCVRENACPTGALVAQEVHAPSIDAEACRGCRRCARVCPAGAISMVPHPGREKEVACIDRSRCIGCGACASACRPRAIALRSLTVPRLVHPEKCIGCGACEHRCPTRPPRAALRVIPRAVHLKIPASQPSHQH